MLLVNSWKRVLAKQWWKLMAITRPSSTLTELFEFMLSTAQIRSTNSQGDQLDFEDLVALAYSITNENFGTALKLSRNSIEDNKYDRAAKWAADAGSAAAYWPQRQIANLIMSGKGATNVSYDEVPFFSSEHPVNPYDDSLGTYSNLHTGMALTPSNIAAGVALIAAIVSPANAPRYLEPEILLVDPSNRLAAVSATNAELITDPLNVGHLAAGTNVIKGTYGLGQPIVAPELSPQPGVWYLGVKADEDALQGGSSTRSASPSSSPRTRG